MYDSWLHSFIYDSEGNIVLIHIYFLFNGLANNQKIEYECQKKYGQFSSVEFFLIGEV